jgi:cytochrome c553
MRIGLPKILMMVAVATLAAPVARAGADPQAIEFFEKQVRPILAENCFKCHGPDKQKAGLRWDHISFILEGGDRGPEIVPGDPAASRMIEAIGYGNEDLKMPPTGKLGDQQIATLTKWVQLGAPWPDEPAPAGPRGREKFDVERMKTEHWAWAPLRVSKPPAVKDEVWAPRPIDRFIAAKLEAAGLHHAPPAERHALIRRVYFDLIGLPPTPGQVRAFINDSSPNAYEQVVDELLASPHFGERWARHWMDSMRYAETYGHEFDYPIPHAWRYRDYLIRAFNADVPYDQFTLEHLAGDLLPEPRRHPEQRFRGFNESIIATGWWYLHEQTHAPTDVRQHEADRIDNQIDALGKTFLGLTLGCARCHDHKFDAISTRDYYALAGFLQSSRQHEAQLDPGETIRAAVAQLQAIRNEADTLMHGVKTPENTAKTPEGEHVVFEGFSGPDYGGWFATGYAFGAAPTQPGQWDRNVEAPALLRPGLADSGQLSPKLEGTLRSPTFTITHPRIHIRAAGRGSVHLIIDGYSMARYQPLLFKGLDEKIDRPDTLGWTTLTGDLHNHLGHTAYLEFTDDGDGALAVDQIVFSHDGQGLAADEPLHLPADPSLDTERFAELRRRAEAIDATIPQPQRVLAITDGTGEDSYVHIRGSYKSVGDTVPRRGLEAFVGSAGVDVQRGSGRLILAQQIVDPSITPLTPRVMVNRVWHHLFGVGLVPSIDNFGKLGQPPTHPELLDYLTDEFVRDGWSIKRLVRRMVLSNTYRMSSRPADERAERVDPNNALLHRARLCRLEGEAIRDAILACSGRLDAKLYGESVEVHLTPFMDGRGKPKSGPLDGDGRRSLYTKIRRNFLPPMMLAFDMPIPFNAMGQRTVSNVPAQALILMNDPFVVQQAELSAKRVLAIPGKSVEQRLADLYETAYARRPTADEIRQSIAFMNAQLAGYNKPAEAIEHDVQVWADLCHVLMNVKEFFFIH